MKTCTLINRELTELELNALWRAATGHTLAAGHAVQPCTLILAGHDAIFKLARCARLNGGDAAFSVQQAMRVTTPEYLNLEEVDSIIARVIRWKSGSQAPVCRPNVV